MRERDWCMKPNEVMSFSKRKVAFFTNRLCNIAQTIKFFAVHHFLWYWPVVIITMYVKLDVWKHQHRKYREIHKAEEWELYFSIKVLSSEKVIQLPDRKLHLCREIYWFHTDEDIWFIIAGICRCLSFFHNTWD